MAQSWHKLVPTVADLIPTVGRMDATGKWNDARLDEFAQRTEENFREVRTEIRDEVGGLRTEMNARFANLEGKIEQRFNILFGALATGFVGAVVSHFLG